MNRKDILTKHLTEPQYRALDKDSYSSLKKFTDDRREYYKKYILKQTLADKTTSSMELGSMVDCLIFERSEFDKRYTVANVSKPSGALGKFTENVIALTANNLDSDGALSLTMDKLLDIAYENTKYDLSGEQVAFKRKGDTLDAIKERWLLGDGLAYYKQIRKAESEGKIFVEPKEIAYAENILRTVKQNPKVKEILDKVNDDRWECHVQLPIEFEYNGLEMKALLDRVIIDHKEKKVNVYDLKTSWNVEDWINQSFLTYKYYIQAVVYKEALLALQARGIIPADYTIENMQFIVCDSTSECSPEIYVVDDYTYKVFKEIGFTSKGVEYKSVDAIVDDVTIHRDSDIWIHSIRQIMTDFEPRIIDIT